MPRFLKAVQWVAAFAVITSAFNFLPTTDSLAQAPPLRVFASNAVKAVIEGLRPQCEQAIGRPLAIRFDTSTALKKAADAGEPFDVAIFNSEFMDAMVKEQKVDAASRTDVARSGLGLAVRKSAPKPDVATPESIKSALLQAKGIAYPQAGASTPFIIKMFADLGIAAQLQGSLRPQPTTVMAISRVASGDAELLVTLLSEIIPEHEIDLVGPLPPPFQNYLSFSAAVGAQAADKDSARALIRFLETPAVLPVFRAQGMESPKNPVP